MSQETRTASAWRGDFDRRLTERLRERGFASATEYVAGQPAASLIALANGLGADVAAVQLERRLFDEAKAAGAVERHLRDLLVRSLHEHLPEGWQLDWGPDVPGDTTTAWARRARTFAHWAPAGWLEDYKDAIDAIIDVIAEGGSPFPQGWLPMDADDPILVAFFQKHWRHG
ncbi:MAG: NUDIX hydrolase [Kofleriaceae bacterium]|nr:MAG: NUDIX hydrolase [Kofleriaceae bacterium]